MQKDVLPYNPLMIGFSELRQSGRERPLLFKRGKGVFLYDEHDRKLLDAASAFYCVSIGYGDEEVIEAMRRQARDLSFAVTAEGRSTAVAMELAEKLVALAPMERSRVLFAVSGSEANDFLIKLIWFRNLACGEPRRRRIITRLGGYHGVTIGTAAAGGSAPVSAAFGVPHGDSLHVTQPDYFNEALPGEDEAAFVARLAAQLRDSIEHAGPETIAGFMAEPINFASGFFPPPTGYWPAIRKILDDYAIPMLSDEVVTGFGRCGDWFASPAIGIAPAAITCGKGLTGAYAPLSATIISGDLYDGIEEASAAVGGFRHAGTFAGHPVAAAAALAVIGIIEKRNILAALPARIAALHAILEQFRGHPLVADVRMHGLGGALQLRGDAGLGEQFHALTMDRGLLLRVTGHHAIIAPPLTITLEELELLHERLAASLEALLDAPAARELLVAMR